MNVDKNAEYTVRNYGSTVIIKTRDQNYAIPRGTEDHPAEFPLTLGELQYVNSNSKVFQIGLLFFAPEDEEALYQALRISNWRDIMHNSEIDEIILRPTSIGVKKLLGIQNPAYFERIYGRYIYLKNTNHPMSNYIERIIKLRKTEFLQKKLKSEIPVAEDENPVPKVDVQDIKIAQMQKQIEELTAMLDQALKAGKQEAPKEKELGTVQPEAKTVKETAKRSTGRRTTRRTKETKEE